MRRRTVRIMIYGASGCGACAAEARSCFAPTLGLARHGFVPTGDPKIADALVIAGSLNARSARVARNLRAAMPRDSRVIAVGACAADGCKVADTAEPVAVAEVLDVAHTLPGCPHDPQELVNALVAMFEETGEGRRDADR